MPKHTKTATGIAQLTYDTPKTPFDVQITSLIPYEALVTKIKIEYIKVPRAEANAAWSQSRKDFEALLRKQHLAAVKTNATRKAKKAECEARNVQ